MLRMTQNVVYIKLHVSADLEKHAILHKILSHHRSQHILLMKNYCIGTSNSRI